MELLTAAFVQLEADHEDTTEARELLASYGVNIPAYRRRSNNQKALEVELTIRELLAQGLSKSAIAKQLKVNRRVVIRVARESQSAQPRKNGVSNDLGKSKR